MNQIVVNKRTLRNKNFIGYLNFSVQTQKRNFGFLTQYYRPNFLAAKLFETKISITSEDNIPWEIAEYATYFLKANQYIASSVYERAKLFHIDSALCAVAALALKARAPTILRN